MKLVICSRYSSELQNQQFCDYQEREIRTGLARLDVDASTANVIRDFAVSGRAPQFTTLTLLLAIAGYCGLLGIVMCGVGAQSLLAHRYRDELPRGANHVRCRIPELSVCNYTSPRYADRVAVGRVRYSPIRRKRTRRQPLIYTRYSSIHQSDKSCEDQEREVRALLRRMGFDDSDAIVIHDRAETATTNDRPGFNQAIELIKQGTISLMAVDDQARASRCDDVMSVVKDIVFCGTRFISGDGVDTNENGWQLKVRLLGIHNATCSEETARRVRRGMRGRVLDNKSAGDIPFGYRSYFDDPEYAVNYTGRGPKPSKSIEIYEPEARWIRQIFKWVADGVSFGKIAKRLQKAKAPLGRNMKKWSPQAVSRLVRKVKKYTGEEWTWGATTTIRDGGDRKKQIAVPENQITRVSRPHLRIVDTETAARAMKQVARIDAIFGYKEGQKRRGCKEHHSRAYPKDILLKLLRCGPCGAEMHHNQSRGIVYRQCKNTGYGPDDCRAKTRPPAEATKRVLTEFVAAILRAVPEWLEVAICAMNDCVRSQQTQLPEKIKELRKQQAELHARRARLLELIEMGTPTLSLQESGSPSSIIERITQLDKEIGQIEQNVEVAERQLDSSIKLPDKQWVAKQVRNLPTALGADESRAATLLGELFDEVQVFRVTPPGKQRGYHQLRFRLRAWRIINAALNGKLPESVTSFISEAIRVVDDESPEFCLNVGGPTRADDAAELILKRRREGATWKQISEATGLSKSTAQACFTRHNKATRLDDANLAEDEKPADGDSPPPDVIVGD